MREIKEKGKKLGLVSLSPRQRGQPKALRTAGLLFGCSNGGLSRSRGRIYKKYTTKKTKTKTKKKKTKQRLIRRSISILCCQCIVDIRKFLGTVITSRGPLRKKSVSPLFTPSSVSVNESLCNPRFCFVFPVFIFLV
ncbi:hypothetical protein SRHO_G00049420 [Serrasalmus rhombeus]